MTTSQDERYSNRQRQRADVVWGCSIHQTPRGETCQHCLDQGDLFGRSDVPAQRGWRRSR
jgi:hypothetical protein